MATFEKTHFFGTTINIDDNTYKNCTFDGCVLVYSGGPIPKLISNSFADCKWKFDGAASRTITLMRALYNGGAKEMIDATLIDMRKPMPDAE